MNIGKETEFVEFKETIAETEKGIDSMSAMLNKHGKGILYFGVKNNGDVAGQSIGESTLNKLSQNIARELKPSCRYTISEKISGEGRHFIEVEFSGNRTPYSSMGRYFLRFHDEDRQMDNETLRQYYLAQRTDYSDWEKADSGCTVECINEEQLKAYLARGTEKGRIALHYTTATAILGKLGLMFNDVDLNNAGNVLFSAGKPVRLKLVKFASETRLTILSLQVFEGNIFECIEKAMDFLASNIEWRITLSGGIRRSEEPEIPMQAAREIVVNAFSHGDYNTGTDFEIDIYSNRICIYSPGMFPKPYTPEDFATKGLEPIPLNITISDILFRDGTIEQVSTGFERTFEACRACGVAYEYSETATGFRFTFFRTEQKSSQPMTKTEEKILASIRENPHIATSELAETADVTVRTVQRVIRQLKERGVLVQQETDAGLRWMMND